MGYPPIKEERNPQQQVPPSPLSSSIPPAVVGRLCSSLLTGVFSPYPVVNPQRSRLTSFRRWWGEVETEAGCVERDGGEGERSSKEELESCESSL